MVPSAICALSLASLEQFVTKLLPSVKQAFIDQVPFGCLGTLEDIARVVLFLSGNDAGWVTGQVVQASGGFFVSSG